ETASTNHGDIQWFQHTLYAAAFAICSVQDGKHDVDLDAISARKEGEAVIVRVEDEAQRFAPVNFPLYAHREKPLPTPADADGHQLEFALVEELVDVFC